MDIENDPGHVKYQCKPPTPSPHLLVAQCTLCPSYRQSRPSNEGRPVLLVTHLRQTTYRHLFVVGRRSTLYSNSGSCELMYVLLIVEQRLRSSIGDMWPLYNSQAEKHDPQLMERWKGQTDTVLTFVRAESFSLMGILSPDHSSLDSSPSLLLYFWPRPSVGSDQIQQTCCSGRYRFSSPSRPTQHSLQLQMSYLLVPATWTSP